jgi:alpha-2-macroglobulin
MERSNRRLLLVVAATLSLSLLFALSCALTGGVGSTLPEGFGAPAPAGRALGPVSPGSWQPRAPAQPLRVIHRSPVANAGGASAILVTFNQPMTSLGPSPKGQPALRNCPIRVQPAVHGACRWVAGDTLKLALNRPLKNAHRYSVTIPTTLKALSGAALPQPESWSFQTPLPELLSASPHPPNRVRADRLLRDDALRLTFNVRVQPGQVARHARLEAGGQVFPCEASHVVDAKTKKPDLKRVVLRPRKPLPGGAKVTLVLPPGLSSTEGPLRSRKAKRRAYSTPAPLTLSFSCDNKPLQPGATCWPMSNHHHAGLEVELSEPVTAKALARALRVTPRLRRKLRATGGEWCGPKDRCARSWRVDEDLLPRRRYRVSVAAGLLDIFGQRLERSAVERFTTRPLPPGLFLPHDAEGFREAWQPFTLKAVNVQRVVLGFTTLSGAELVRFLECLKVRDGDEWPKRCGAAAHTSTRMLKLAAPADRVVTRHLKLPRGLVRMTLSSPQLVWHEDKKPVRLHRLVTITDLGLQARMTPFGVTVWVTGLRGGKAVAGAEVAIHDTKGKQLWSGRTNATGVAQCPGARLGAALQGEEPPDLYVLARKTGDRAYLTLTRDHWYKHWSTRYDDRYDGSRSSRPRRLKPLRLSRQRGWQGAKPLLAGYIASERGIYRPGHRIHLHGAVRRFITWRGSPAAGLKARVVLDGPDNEELASRTVTLSPLGVFKLDLPLPTSGRLGYHHAWLKLGDQLLASAYFKVAEYRAPRFSVQVKATPWAVVGRGSARIDLAGRYMFGGAMDGSAFRLSVRSGATSLELPKGSEHHAGADVWTLGSKSTTWLRRGGVLDRQGQRQQTLKLPPLPRQPFPMGHTVEAQVRSPAGRTVARRAYVTQHPGERYAAIKDLVGKDREHHRHVLVVDPQGKIKSGARVEARLYAMKKKPRTRWSLQVDWARVLWTRAQKVPAAGALLRVPWPRRYEESTALLVLVARDAAGREAWTAQRLSKPDDYSEAQNVKERLEQRRDRQLSVKTDKQRYLPGETAIVTVQRSAGGPGAPAPGGEAMLFVERERIFKALPLRFDKRGRATLRLKVKPAYARKIALRAVAPRRGPALRGNLGPLVTATAAIEVSDRPFQLGIKLKTDREAYRPGQEVKVALQVKDGLNRPRRAQVVLMAVDEAVLQMTGFRLPDPFRPLLHTPKLQVLADDVRRHLLDLRIPVVHRAWGRESAGFGGTGFGTIGGGGGGGGGGVGRGSAGSSSKRKRSNFKTTAWHATLVTNAQGHAKTSFRLPDNLTRYRIMAFAVDDRRSAGTGRTSFSVDLPLVTLPVLPRLLRVGDAAQAGVLIQNTALRKGTVKVQLKLKGQALALSGSANKSVTLTKGQSATVRFDLRARQVGAGKLTFAVSGPDGVSDILVHELRVQPLALMEAASVSGETKGAVAQGIAPLGALQPGRGGLEVSLSATALSGVEDGMEQLIGYPYGCLEQKSSKLLALMAAAVLGDRFSLKLPGKPAELIRGGVRDILAMQRHDGGFGYWPNARNSDPYATAYALIVLHRAQLAAGTTGVQVPDSPVHNALAYMQRYIKYSSKQRWWYSDMRYAIHTFMVYALALHGKRMSKSIRALFERREHKPLFVRSMLLSALAAAKPDKRSAAMQAALIRELSDSLRVDGTHAHAEENLHDGYKVLMHSNDRTTAMVLLALLAAKPEHPMVPRLVRWFLLGRKQARFRNTQEAAWALLALWDYARIREKVVPDFEAGVWVGGKRVVKARFSGRSVKPQLKSIPMAALMKQAGAAARQLMIAKRGRGTLYYVARLRYARKTLPRQAKDRGLKVSKRIQVLDRAGKPLATPRPPRLNDTVLVTLEVQSNEARRYLVLDDPLPAGLEAIDTGLATAGSFGARLLWKGGSRFDHRELRDDRVLFFRDHKQPGTLTYRYLARVTTVGTFAAPPTKAEEMYTPEVYGHTAAASVSYRAP